MGWREEILEMASIWEERTGMKRSTAALRMMGAAKFFDRIEAGEGCTVDTLEKAKSWLQKNTPKEDQSYPQT